jgi:hypothetical protein
MGSAYKILTHNVKYVFKVYDFYLKYFSMWGISLFKEIKENTFDFVKCGVFVASRMAAVGFCMQEVNVHDSDV